MHFNSRPIPEDFRDFATEMSRRELQRHYSAGQATICRWLTEIGCRALRRPRSHMPAEFPSYAASMTVAELKAKHRVGHERIKVWCKLAGVTPKRNGLRPVPSDFIEAAKFTTKNMLMKNYRADWKTVSRWIEETGVSTAQYIPTPPPASSRGIVFRGHAATPLARDLRHITIFDQAADALRRERFVVYRCDQRGRYAEKGNHWRLGNTLLTPDELLQRAAKYREKAA